MAEIQSTVSRRSFIAGIGAAAAGAAVAGPVLPVPPPPVPYLEELARFARTLEPRFRKGSLHAYREGEDRAARERDESYTDPIFEIDNLAERHFGLSLDIVRTVNGERYRGDAPRARLILNASPRADVTGDGALHACCHAVEAIAWDTIAYARDAGWYVPTLDETQDPLLEFEQCPECGDDRFLHRHEGETHERHIKCAVVFRRHVAHARLA